MTARDALRQDWACWVGVVLLGAVIVGLLVQYGLNAWDGGGRSLVALLVAVWLNLAGGGVLRAVFGTGARWAPVQLFVILTALLGGALVYYGASGWQSPAGLILPLLGLGWAVGLVLVARARPWA